jgi:TRAP-type C4-dicarboxylate transport system permease small subunit
MDSLISVNRKISRVLVWLGGTMLVVASAYVSLDVLARKIFNFSFNGADEIAGYSLAISLTFGLAFALFERAHIRIDLAVAGLPFRLRSIFDLIAMAAFAIFIAVLSWYAFFKVMDTFANSSRSVTPLQTPLIIPQGLWLFGLLFCLFCASCLFIAAMLKLRQGDAEGFNQLVGAKSVDEEIQSELGTKPGPSAAAKGER